MFSQLGIILKRRKVYTDLKQYDRIRTGSTIAYNSSII